jgi:peptide/nickel transport system substrate-binding protein
MASYVGLLACVMYGSAFAQGERVVLVGSTSQLAVFNVLYTDGGLSLEAAKHVQRGLLMVADPASGAVWSGELALDVPSTQNGGVQVDGDRMSITYHLRQGVTWHDGEPVTSADVKATWEMIMNPENAVVTRFGYNLIDSIDTPDDHTVIMHFREPFPAWPILFDAIIAQHVIEANSPGLDDSQAMRQPMGFGPFMWTEIRTGEQAVMVAFDDYWQGRPQIDRMVLTSYPSTDALLQAIEAGAIDIAWRVNISDVPAVQALEPRGIRVLTNPQPGSDRYIMNADASQAPIFADRNVRLAIHHAIDRQLIVDQLLRGSAEIAVSEWHGSAWVHPDLPEYEFDPERSRSLLEESGWVLGSDGIRSRNGERLSFRHTVITGDALRENVQVVVQQMLRNVGIEVVIDNARTSALFGRWADGGRWSRGDYDLGGWAHGLRVPDPEVSARYLCSQIASDANPAGSQWYRYCNEEVDALMRLQSTTIDADERHQLILRAQELIHEDAYHVYLYSSPSFYTANANIRNFELHPFGVSYWKAHLLEWHP